MVTVPMTAMVATPARVPVRSGQNCNATTIARQTPAATGSGHCEYRMDGGGGERRRVAKITAARGRRTSRTVRRRRAVSRRPAGESSPPGPARPATSAVGDGGEVRAEAGRHFAARSGGAEAVIPIILDGENAWEQYPNNGNDFLRALYGKLEADDRFETVRISDFLEKAPATVELPRLHTGSWIEASLRVWSGEPAHARAWSALERTRRFAQEQWGSLRYMPKSVRQPLMVAEGSDWFWWYSSRNSSPEDGVFDALFRANLEVVWWFAGAEPPDDIRSPLMDPQRVTAAGNRIGAMLPGAGERYG